MPSEANYLSLCRDRIVVQIELQNIEKNLGHVSYLRLRSTLSAAEASCRASAAATEAASLICKAFCKIAQKMQIHHMGVTAAKLKDPTKQGCSKRSMKLQRNLHNNN
jgi:hypothetical protein